MPTTPFEEKKIVFKNSVEIFVSSLKERSYIF